jgi:aminoglycoside phosphotransferase family enzyme/predicted kinase
MDKAVGRSGERFDFWQSMIRCSSPQTSGKRDVVTNALSRHGEAQSVLLKFLLDPGSYPHHPEGVHMLQTHSSWVFLAGEFVYKVKKPVNFGFLDFSTLERRKHFCMREVELNRRLCSDVYLGVVPISCKDGHIVFGPGDEIAEYAVQMRKLPDHFFMLRLMERGEVGTAEIVRIVTTLSKFYKAQRPGAEIAAWGRIAKLKISTDENFRQTVDFIGQTISRPAFEGIRSFTGAFYRTQAPLFADRVIKRRILDCHGDLHMDHIHIGPEHLAIYDCIEFNDRFRHIDVASDVAFLAMDLDFHRRSDLSRYFTAEMAVALDDPEMLGLMDFYKCYRAYVRGKVESIQQSAAGVPDLERRKSRVRARRYFRLALQYAVAGSRPMVIAVMGRVASGKSTLARSLSEELGWKFFSSDRIRKELAGVSLYIRGDEIERGRLYSESMSNKTYEALRRHATEQLEQHRGVILDATFSSPHRRQGLRRAIEGMGADYCFIESLAGVATIRQRLAARAKSSHEISDARLEDFEALDRGYEAPVELQRQHHVGVKTARTIEAVLATTLKALARRRAANPNLS